MQINKRETVSITVDGAEAELEFEPNSGDDILTERVGDTLVVAYLVHDTDCGSVDDMLGDGMGHLYSLHRQAPRGDHQKALEAMGFDRYGEPNDDLTPDKDAVLLDCYDHGGQRWSVRSEGYQCLFDTARGAGVWVPDSYLREQLDDDEAADKSRQEQARVYCRQFLKQYNAILAGDVYGCVTQTYELSGGEWREVGDFESCWQFVNHQYAMETLKAEYLDAPAARLKERVAA